MMRAGASAWHWLGNPKLGFLPALAVLAVVFLLPLGYMLWLSVADPALGLGNYLGVFTDGISLRIILRTLKVAAIVASAAVLLAYPYAYAMTITGARLQSLLTIVVLIPFWTSLMARTFAWIIILQANGPLDQALGWLHLGGANILGTTAAVTIGMAQTLMPFSVFPLYSAMLGIDRRLVPAARGLGARPALAFLKVYLPLSLPGVCVSWFLVFVLSLGFYVTPQLLGSSHNALLSQFIAVKVSRQLQFGFGGTLAVLLVVMTLLVLGALTLLVKKRGLAKLA